MKRVTLNLTPSLIVEDDTDVVELQYRVTKEVMRLDGIESVGIGRADTSPVRSGTCRVGPHEFHVDKFFPVDKAVPDICRGHWMEEKETEAAEEHAPLFEEVERLTGLVGHIWQSGGMTMTVVIPLPEADDGYPCYMALQEGVEDDGRWSGSIGFYSTPEDDEGDQLWHGYDEDALTPQQWAEKIATHYTTYRNTQS